MRRHKQKTNLSKALATKSSFPTQTPRKHEGK